MKHKHLKHPRARTTRTHKKNHKPHFYAACGAVLVVGGIFAFMFYTNPDALSSVQKAPTIVAIATTTPPMTGPDAYTRLSLIGKSAIVYDLVTGETLYAQNANASRPLASITKLLTLYAAANTLPGSAVITMTPASVAEVNDAADAGFHEGESFAFEDIARLTLAASSNSGAEAIAEAANTAHSTDTTSLLAGAAASVGLTATHASNGSGLDISSTVSGGYGSARDVAVLAGALLKKAPLIAEATTQPYVSITSLQGTTHTFVNTNIDVTHIPNPLLSKTGYTDLAGGNLVVVYDAAINHPVAIVVLGSTEAGRFTDVQQLMSATLAHFAGIMPK